MAPVLAPSELHQCRKQKISNWPLRRFDRELNSVIASLSGSVKQKWWAKEGVTASAEVVLGDSIAAHLPSLGLSGVNAALLRALLRPCQGVPHLDADTYTKLLSRFGLGREFATAWINLETTRHEASSSLIANAGDIANAFIAALACGESEPNESKKGSDGLELMLAFLSLFCGSSASAAAASLRSRGEQLPRSRVRTLAREAVSLALDVVRSDPPEGSCKLLGSLSLCVAGLSGRSLAGDVELGRLSKQLRPLLHQHGGSLSQSQQAWLQVLDIVDQEVTMSSDNDATEACAKLHEADRRLLLTEREAALECLDFIWPSKDIQSCQKSNLAKESAAPAESFKINLYANPAARATQDAVVAALPPARRTETLLSVSKAGELEKVIPQFLQAWQESSEECASVALRSDAEGSAAWPIEVLVPLLAALVDCDSVGWQHAFSCNFPADRSLFDAFWAHLCNASPAVSCRFWPWALGTFCIARLSGVERDVEFGIHCALRLALTLQADFAGAKAKIELQQALVVKQSFGIESVVMNGRIGGFKYAPISSLLLSLSENLEGGRRASQNSVAFESADEALERWVLLIKAVADDCSESALVTELIHHLARIRSASASIGSYGRLHLAALTVDVSPSIQEEASLLRACILARAAPELAQLQREALGLEATTFDPLPYIFSALDIWPIRQLITLTLRVLPAIIDSCQLILPHGEVVGRELLTEPLSSSPVLRSIACLLCCAAAKAHASSSEALAQLRLGTDVARAASHRLHSGFSSSSERSRDIVELCVLFGSFMHALAKSAPKLLAETSGPATAAALLMRMFLKAAAQEGHENCCASFSDTMRQLDSLPP